MPLQSTDGTKAAPRRPAPLHLIEYQAQPTNALPDLPEPFALPANAVTMIGLSLHDILETQPSAHKLATGVRTWIAQAADMLTGIADHLDMEDRAHQSVLAQMRKSCAELHDQRAAIQRQAHVLSSQVMALQRRWKASEGFVLGFIVAVWICTALAERDAWLPLLWRRLDVVRGWVEVGL